MYYSFKKKKNENNAAVGGSRTLLLKNKAFPKKKKKKCEIGLVRGPCIFNCSIHFPEVVPEKLYWTHFSGKSSIFALSPVKAMRYFLQPLESLLQSYPPIGCQIASSQKYLGSYQIIPYTDISESQLRVKFQLFHVIQLIHTDSWSPPIPVLSQLMVGSHLRPALYKLLFRKMDYLALVHSEVPVFSCSYLCPLGARTNMAVASLPIQFTVTFSRCLSKGPPPRCSFI